MTDLTLSNFGAAAAIIMGVAYVYLVLKACWDWYKEIRK